MKTAIQKLPKSKIEIRIEVPAQEFNSFVEKATVELGKDLEVSGFRKGRAPKEVIEREIGLEKIISEAVQNCVRENYKKAVRENQLEPLGQPQVEVFKLPTVRTQAPGNPLEFKATFPVMPEVKLPDYRAIATMVKRNKVEVSEIEIEDALKWLQKSRAKFILKSGPAERGDWVEIEYKIGNGAKAEASLTGDAFILGEGHFSPGFEDNLIGMEQGQEKEFFLSPPKMKENRSELPQRYGVRVKVKSVQKMELPEMNDEFAKNLGKFENFTALKQSVSSGLKMEKEKEESQRVRQEILEKIAQKSEMELPEILVQAQKKRYLENLKREVADKLQTGFEDYLKKIKKTEEDLLESFQIPAQTQVRNSLVMQEIQKRENIGVSEEEVVQEANKILQNFPGPKKTREKFDPEQLKRYTEEIIKQEKTFQRLMTMTNDDDKL